ncbi:MAG: DUF1549 domain-containing protein, partial [Planctomycetes bacterium]|nr:DUF1549 domain-containing protein [Planctomycetota bacterium]
MSRIPFLLSGVAAVAAVTVPMHVAFASDRPTAQQLEFFEKKIRPVLIAHCYKCHSSKAKKVKGALLLDTRAGLRKGGDSGSIVQPGNPKKSLLIRALNYDGTEMPPSGKLPQRVIADFEAWVRMGAPDPRDGPATVAKKTAVDYRLGLKFWAFQPPKNPPLPSVKDTVWPQRDLDRFVLARLQRASLKPSPPAEKQVLIRRAYFDLIGLPPTAQEVAAFLQDDSADAFVRVVDRLLKSPHYGERWGRRWLDVARFGEDQAHTFKARRYPRGYLYRDWVVKALNDDMPYNRFVMEQIAGDLLPGPKKHERLAALGFFALGPVYYQDNGEKAIALADEWDDRIDTLTRGLLGLTVSCARCHDHKFDPISMQDYYGLAGIFSSSQYQERPIASAEAVLKKQRADQAVKQQQLKID